MSVLVEIYRNKSCICPTELFSLKLWRAVEAACVRTCGKHIWHCSQRLSWVPGFPDLDKLVSKRSRFQSAPTQKMHPESVNIKRDTRDQSPATLEGVGSALSKSLLEKRVEEKRRETLDHFFSAGRFCVTSSCWSQQLWGRAGHCISGERCVSWSRGQDRAKIFKTLQCRERKKRWESKRGQHIKKKGGEVRRRMYACVHMGKEMMQKMQRFRRDRR